ncbi:MAG: hypothetical protein LBS73_01315 [Campylobacteraceae bacterium]|jgi:hypothetical protein|nr:hypothetical protein [Campylobacteraceae bacterium]
MNIKNTLLAIIGFIPFLSGCSNLPLEVPNQNSEVVEVRAEPANDNFEASVARGVVEIGMDIEQAITAGGSFSFVVSADESVWGEDANPYRVIGAQKSNPDNSRIKFTFHNSRQFGEEKSVSFQVEIKLGKVVSITRL